MTGWKPRDFVNQAHQRFHDVADVERDWYLAPENPDLPGSQASGNLFMAVLSALPASSIFSSPIRIFEVDRRKFEETGAMGALFAIVSVPRGSPANDIFHSYSDEAKERLDEKRSWMSGSPAGAQAPLARHKGCFKMAALEAFLSAAISREPIHLWEGDTTKLETRRPGQWKSPVEHTGGIIWAAFIVPQGSPARVELRGSKD